MLRKIAQPPHRRVSGAMAAFGVGSASIHLVVNILSLQPIPYIVIMRPFAAGAWVVRDVDVDVLAEEIEGNILIADAGLDHAAEIIELRVAVLAVGGLTGIAGEAQAAVAIIEELRLAAIGRFGADELAEGVVVVFGDLCVRWRLAAVGSIAEHIDAARGNGADKAACTVVVMQGEVNHVERELDDDVFIEVGGVAALLLVLLCKPGDGRLNAAVDAAGDSLPYSAENGFFAGNRGEGVDVSRCRWCVDPAPADVGAGFYSADAVGEFSE